MSAGTERVTGTTSGRVQDAIDEIPQRHRLALRDEVRLARDRRSWREAVGREQMGIGGIVDVNAVDELRFRADAAQPAGQRGKDARNQVVVAADPR